MTIFLYIKQHKITGLKYFGKTTRDPYKYYGSGKYWKRHLKTHGKFVETLKVWEFPSEKECSSFALSFSVENNIVESENWANLKFENGMDGGFFGNHTDDAKSKMRKPKTNKVNMGGYWRGKSLSEETKAKMRASALNRKHSQETIIKLKRPKSNTENMKGHKKPLRSEQNRIMNSLRKGKKYNKELRKYI